MISLRSKPPRFARRLSRAAAMGAALLLGAGCSYFDPLERVPPLTAASDARRYDLAGVPVTRGDPGVLVAVAMSGGGKRSAAFSYGVLNGLREFRFGIAGKERNLLDEVDMISAVSGGAFTAAYYGLHREAIFERYVAEFLKQDIESYIYGTYLLPWRWRWMADPYYGTNDKMAEIYDRLLFRGARYKDLHAKGRPLIVLNATDISLGSIFRFNQDFASAICLDLQEYPVALAVAASNGFPVVFTPITLKNNAGACPRDPLVARNLARLAAEPALSRERAAIESQLRYSDPAKTPYVHLMDGGIAGNLGVRGLLDSMVILHREPRLIEELGLLRVRRAIVIVADGQAVNQGERARQRIVTSFSQVFSAVSGTQIDRYNLETLLFAQHELNEFARVLRQLRCRKARLIEGYPCDDVQAYLVHLSLADVPDAKVRERLQAIPTGLTLADADIDLLVESGRGAVARSAELARFRKSLERGFKPAQ